MEIKKLFSGIDYEQKGRDIDIASLQKYSADEVVSGLFFCYKGVNYDGKEKVFEAIKNGAVAIVVEDFVDVNICQIKVENVRKIISKVCSNFFGNPDKDLKIIGISGTNGKTTTSYILRNILHSAGKKVGVIGTNAIYINDICIKATLTTPDPYELFEIFSQMLKAGVEYVVMEVSAHAIDLYKVWGIRFEAGLFTNLSRDHLDYFETMERYKAAKQKFFCKDYCKVCVFNFDDGVGRDFYRNCDCKKYSYAIINPSDLFAINIEMSLKGSNFVVNFEDEIMEVEISLAGKFNVYNSMGAIAVAKILGIGSDNIVAGIYTMPQVDGRFNLYKVGSKNVIIDFAHTPDGMENVLRTARSLSEGEIVTVFGCGGNRDSGKRKIMGEVASKYSDKIFLTSDNPRFEDPCKIIEDIKSGTQDAVVLENRKEAIITAIKTSSPFATILVLGKGAEDYQEQNGIKHPYSDKEVVFEYIEKSKIKKIKE